MKKKNWPAVILITVFFIGLCIFLYPTVGNLLNKLNQSRVIENYEKQVTKLDNADYQKKLDEACEYNRLYAKNSFSYNKESETGSDLYRKTLDMGGGVMGYLKIDKLNLRLPIYHGTSSTVLQSGLGHMPMTSLPVGGEGTHAVLSGHSGLPSAELLTKLDQIETGDIFYICVLDEILAYEVRDINTIMPYELDVLSIDQREDKVSLVTCTPYGINTHRLVVTGYRIPYKDNFAEHDKETAKNISLQTIVLCICVPLFLIIIVILIRFRMKNRKKGIAKNDEKVNRD